MNESWRGDRQADVTHRACRIAILGATSQIARDLIVAVARDPMVEAFLFSRRPLDVECWLALSGLAGRFMCRDYQGFGVESFDCIINFVGVGDPAKREAIGAGIFEVTQQFDELALSYLRRHTACRYFFMSSGAAYCSSFERPVDVTSVASVPLNHFTRSDWYGAAKLHAECRHRALHDLGIIDIRVFGYFSRSQNLTGRFFLSEIVSAIVQNRILMVTEQPIVRDFLHPHDFYTLIKCLLTAPPTNDSVDTYTLGTINKEGLLATMRDQFGLSFVVVPEKDKGDGGLRENYYSLNRKAADFGYRPAYTSRECVVEETDAILRSAHPRVAGQQVGDALASNGV